jgi:hypothetical protein
MSTEGYRTTRLADFSGVSFSFSSHHTLSLPRDELPRTAMTGGGMIFPTVGIAHDQFIVGVSEEAPYSSAGRRIAYLCRSVCRIVAKRCTNIRCKAVWAGGT